MSQNAMSKAIAATADTSSTQKKKVVTVTNPETDKKAIEKLITARIGLLLKAPFFGNLATRLILRNSDEWLETLATDGKYFYYNSEFVNKMNIRQVEFGFGHETLHNVYDHMGRRGDRDPQLFNIAADYCVNQDLLDQKIGEKITVVQILHDTKYKGMCAEEVYDLLYKDAKKIDIGKLAGMILDEHLDGNGDGDSQGGKQGGAGGRPILSDEEKRQIRDEIKEAVLSAAQSCGAGNLPAGVKRMLSDMTEPKMNWRELLQQQIESTIKADYTWMKPSRRSWHMDAILPGQNQAEMIDICISVDLSGSISQKQCKEFFSEIYGIMQMYSEAFRVRVWTFDTEVYNPAEFTQDNLYDILDYVPQGGGGTTFEANWEFMKENDIVPKKFIMFTDGYPCGSWGDPDYCDTLFVIHGSKTIEAPYGTTTYYEE